MSGPFQFSSESIAPPTVAVEFCDLRDLEGETPLTRPDLYARAPWYLPGSFRDGPLIAVYSDGVYLPDHTLVAALATDDWCRRVAVPGQALWRWYRHFPDGSR